MAFVLSRSVAESPQTPSTSANPDQRRSSATSCGATACYSGGNEGRVCLCCLRGRRPGSYAQGVEERQGREMKKEHIGCGLARGSAMGSAPVRDDRRGS